MNFAVNHMKIKSNWFEENGLYSKIGHDAFLLYMNLHRYHVPNQEKFTFATSIKQLSQDTKFTKPVTLDLLKRLIRYKVVSCSVGEKWDRYTESDFMTVTALDKPKTTRTEGTKDGKPYWYDKPDSPDDMYVAVDTRLMQHYINIKFDGREMGLFCLIVKLSHNTENKSWMSINAMAEILGLSNDKVSKMIYQLNRNYLMLSSYRKNGYKIVNGKKEVKYSFEHKICHNVTYCDSFNIGWIKDAIDKNVVRWDKRKNKKTKQTVDIDVPVEDDPVSEDIDEKQVHDETTGVQSKEVFWQVTDESDEFDPFDIK